MGVVSAADTATQRCWRWVPASHAAALILLMLLVAACRTVDTRPDGTPSPSPPSSEHVEAPAQPTSPEAVQEAPGVAQDAPPPATEAPDAAEAEDEEPQPRPATRRIRSVTPYERQVSLTETQVLARSRINPRRIGYLVEDARTGELLRDVNAAEPFIPASVAKIASAITALEVLKPEHRFVTRVLHTGRIRKGVLRGDIILKGGGDPTLTAAALRDLAQALARARIRSVKGRFLYDATLFPPQLCINPDQNPEAGYNPPLSALTVDSNVFTVTWSPGTTDGQVEVFTSPGAFASFGVSPVPFGLGEALQRVSRRCDEPPPDGIEQYMFAPDAPRSGTLYLPARDPAARAAELFRLYAKGAGIDLPVPEASSSRPRKPTVLARHRSEPLVSMVQTLLSASDNLTAELVSIATAARLSGAAPQTVDEVGKVLTDWWATRLPQLTEGELLLVNGSGLSDRSRLSPRAVAAMLSYAARRTYGGHSFTSLLAASGVRGTLLSRVAPDTHHVLWAKTGTMDYAVSMAGELDTIGGRRLRFVVLVSDADLRRVRLEQNAREGVSRQRQRAASAWIRKARAVVDGLLLSWAGDEPVTAPMSELGDAPGAPATPELRSKAAPMMDSAPSEAAAARKVVPKRPSRKRR